MRLSTAS